LKLRRKETEVTIVSLKDVVKDYDLGSTVVHALKGVSMDIQSGEFVTIAGASGSGKSTMLNLIGCLDHPTEGHVRVADKSVSALGERELNRLRLYSIGFIFQSFNLIPVLNVYENIELPLLIVPHIGPAERRERVMHFMKEVGLEKQLRQKPSELSGGQRQRVAVARALVTKPPIVLADEPTANLDSKTGIEIIDLMHQINREEGTTFIFSTHDPKIIARADRVIHLEDGQLSGENGK
jgi:putative ABC transport system ATP-binding protein